VAADSASGAAAESASTQIAPDQSAPAHTIRSQGTVTAVSPASTVMSRITRAQLHPADCDMPLRPSVKQALQQVQDAVMATILEGQSNSILVIGPHGCGKTLVRSEMAALKAPYCRVHMF
jgi:transcriptional regulator with AAA-type ATPase domain